MGILGILSVLGGHSRRQPHYRHRNGHGHGCYRQTGHDSTLPNSVRLLRLTAWRNTNDLLHVLKATVLIGVAFAGRGAGSPQG